MAIGMMHFLIKRHQNPRLLIFAYVQVVDCCIKVNIKIKMFTPHNCKLSYHNLIASLYLNFKMLPFRQAIKLPLDVYYGIRFDNLSGKIVLKGKNVHRGMVKFGAQGSDMFQRKGCILALEGTLTLEGSCVFGCSNTIKIRKSAEVTIGNGAIFGAENLLYSENEMRFGDDFLSSWKCQFMDSDTHNIVDLLTGDTTVSVKPVTIGKHCWIGNHVIINKGTHLTDNTIVASRSLVTKDFTTEGEYCVLAGIPAKVIQRNKAWAIDKEGLEQIKNRIHEKEITPPTK